MNKHDLKFLMDLEEVEISPGGRLKPLPPTRLKLCSGIGCDCDKDVGCLKSFLYYMSDGDRSAYNFLKHYLSISSFHSCYYPFDDSRELWIFKIYEPDKMTPEEYEKAEPVILETYRWRIRKRGSL